jgi:Glycosyl hydrolase 2 galactose-binding domain-like/Exo-beta-D-glucosaminidase Ig-fold domain/Concanavalin A-like lectin/glucanases superfamily/Glycosyl hydrolases family 2/Glycosyl hydrolases family 2, TIM barrel domain
VKCWLKPRAAAVLLLLAGLETRAQPPNPDFGPYNATFLSGGIGLTQSVPPDSPVLDGKSPWSLSGWVRAERITDGRVIVAAFGEPLAGQCRCLTLLQGQLGLEVAPGTFLHAHTSLDALAWHAVAATYDGRTARLYLDGAEVESREVAVERVPPVLRLAPESQTDLTGEHHFGGSLALFQLRARALTAAEARELAAARPDFTLITFHHVGVGWPWQERAWRGLLQPQPAWTLPRGNAPPSPPARDLTAAQTPPLQPLGTNRWMIGAWHLAAAESSPGSDTAPLTTVPAVGSSGELLSSSEYADKDWYPAIVPGTVLTTLIANGVYPDPDYGLDNLHIPESLNRRDYWYRSRFVVPAQLAGQKLTLSFNGINYAAEVWLNGVRVGQILGAFVRGIFDVSAIARPGSENVLAVRVSPAPHPGIPHEQSVSAGPGENGGNLAIDGPTFIATEGWDWLPAIRDRNTGIWQDVELSASGLVRILDPQIVTTLPLPRTDSADVLVRLPLENRGASAATIRIDVDIGAIHVGKSVKLPPGVSEIDLSPTELTQLHFAHPRLWWPNGYGNQELYEARIAVSVDGRRSDLKTVRFGIRAITYELSLFDHEGRLRRVEVDPTAASVRHERLVDVRHEALKQTANGWAASLSAAGESSPAVRVIATTSLTPYLAIRVNGVRIAARGGSWGMDDSRKRISRQRLEPYFRLEHDAHLNIVRNWLGQNTEDTFYELADEYGLLVLNDFWESTQNFQVEAQDPQLFLQNARDVIRRYRNHPSIAVWFGRNEGVPQPILNEGLAAAVAELDGTRYYTGSSNVVNLQGSGPYNWRAPEEYFTTLAQGFSVEVGTPSLASAESLRAWIPAADLWPIADTYAYHDWHFGGNGDTASFTHAMQTSLGVAGSFEDFERKAQLMNYVSYRAIFEGFQAHLWTRNSGRLLWMTHPSWPSNSWQIYTSDYDTPAAYYGVAKACEPVHAQLNLPDFRPAIVNISRQARKSLRLRARVVSLEGRRLLEKIDTLDVPADDVTTLDALPLRQLLQAQGLVLVELMLTDSAGTSLSNNLYWESRTDSDLVGLSSMSNQGLLVSATSHPAAAGAVVEIKLTNRGPTPALLAKLTVLDSAGRRVLPAYYSDNYVSLLSGESRAIRATCPAGPNACMSVALRGWNVVPTSVEIHGLR